MGRPITVVEEDGRGGERRKRRKRPPLCSDQVKVPPPPIFPFNSMMALCAAQLLACAPLPMLPHCQLLLTTAPRRNQCQRRNTGRVGQPLFLRRNSRVCCLFPIFLLFRFSLFSFSLDLISGKFSPFVARRFGNFGSDDPTDRLCSSLEGKTAENYIFMRQKKL